jgi:two-component system, OmpR family, sensor histidine kinase VicK
MTSNTSNADNDNDPYLKPSSTKQHLTSSSKDKSALSAPEKTEILYGEENTTKAILQIIDNAHNDIFCCGDHTIASVSLQVEEFKKALLDAKRNRGIKIRYITDVTRDNLQDCKELMEVITDLRHLDGVKGNFGVNETEYAAITVLQKSGLVLQVMYSNAKSIVEQHHYLFKTIWDKSLPAVQKINEIEADMHPEFYDVITNRQKASQVLVDLAKSAKKETLVLLPNDKSMIRLEKSGVVDYIIQASKQSGVEIKIICPLSKVNSYIIKKISDDAPAIKILDGNNSPYGMYIVDGQRLFRAELREPEADDLTNAIGLAVYSNSKPTINSFKSIFELLWNERLLNDQLKISDTMQREFINIAAHELRTPAQSILGYAELASIDPKYSKEQKKELFVDVIYRNAVRLHRLIRDILDVTRIESHTFNLNKERFNLDDVATNVVLDIQRQSLLTRSDKVSITYKADVNNVSRNNDAIFLEADKERIIQVLHNLLDNAVKFSKAGSTVSVTVEKRKQEGANKEKGEQGEIVVKVVDTGIGIDPEIMPRLFTKFATKSLSGTGLGLYISKSIIEAHGGKIWAQNNSSCNGATFAFSLPFPTSSNLSI